MIILFILGLIIGSFLNCVIFRFDTTENLGGRSHCLKCNTTLKVFDLIPLFSYLLLGGKCRYCKSKFSAQYPLVELFTGILFALNYYFFFGFSSNIFDFALINFSISVIALFILSLIISSYFVVIFVYDLKTKIIPDEWSLGLGTTGFLFALIYINEFGSFNNFWSLLDLFSGLIFFSPFYILWKISNGTWLGLGDGKLAVGIGFYLGFIKGVSAMLIAVWSGAVISLLLIALSRLKNKEPYITMKSEVPFAPFMVLGAILAFYFKLDILGLSNLSLNVF